MMRRQRSRPEPLSAGVTPAPECRGRPCRDVITHRRGLVSSRSPGGTQILDHRDPLDTRNRRRTLDRRMRMFRDRRTRTNTRNQRAPKLRRSLRAKNRSPRDTRRRPAPPDRPGKSRSSRHLTPIRLLNRIHDGASDQDRALHRDARHHALVDENRRDRSQGKGPRRDRRDGQYRTAPRIMVDRKLRRAPSSRFPFLQGRGQKFVLGSPFLVREGG